MVDRRHRAVAQFGSALDWGSSGRRFKSCQPDQVSSSSEAVSEKSGTASIALKSPWIATRLRCRGQRAGRPAHPLRVVRWCRRCGRRCARARGGRRADVTRDRVPQHHRGSAHRRADGQGDADHHGRLRPTRTRHHDRAHPRRTGGGSSQRAQGWTPPQGRRRRCRQGAQPREKGITATDIAKMLGVSRATVYRYLSDDTTA